MGRLLASMRFRARRARYGVFNLGPTKKQVNRLWVNGQWVALSFPKEETNEHQHELTKILFDDCYHLRAVDSQPETVLDIGANVGLFALAARKSFPNATIHCYEPNELLAPYLNANCASIAAKCYEQAVGEQSGYVSLETQENSLHSTTQASAHGTVEQVSFRTAIDRMGGYVDLVKLDCEGAEWSIFQDTEAWKLVGRVTMEYHLWAKPDSTIKDLETELNRLGFRVEAISPSSNPAWGLVQAKRLPR